jgi:phosphate transport system substrate-binding protein
MPDDHRMPPHAMIPRTLRRRATIAAIAATGASALIGSPSCASVPEPDLLRIGGTGMALATMRQIGNAFVGAQPDMAVRVLPSLGTGGGVAAVAAAAIELAVAARAPNDADRDKGLQGLAYARTPVAFVTHPAVAVQDITLSEVAQILTGTMLVWPNGTRVRLVRRGPLDADWSMLRALSTDMAKAVTVALERPGLLTVATDQENADALERVIGSFGAMSIGQLRAEARHVVPIALDGVAPDVEALAAGRYSLSRTLYVIWRDPPTQAIARFLAFLRTGQASGVLGRLGHIPLAGAAE